MVDLNTLADYGPMGLLMCMWWYDNRAIRTLIKQRDDATQVLKAYERLANDLKDVVVANTRAITELRDLHTVGGIRRIK